VNPTTPTTLADWIAEAERINGHVPTTAFSFYRAANTNETYDAWEMPDVVKDFLALDGHALAKAVAAARSSR
jgi:hypothetical protein